MKGHSMKPLAILAALAALSACGTTTGTALAIAPDVALAMCQADYETAVAIAERLDYLTDLDGPAIVARVCGPVE